MQNSFRLPLQMLSNISCTRTLRCKVWSWDSRYTGPVEVIQFMQNIFRCNLLPWPPSNHRVLKCLIHIAAQRQASNIAQLDVGYVSEVHNSHICSATLVRDTCPKCTIRIFVWQHQMRNTCPMCAIHRAVPCQASELAELDSGYVSEMHNSHSCGNNIFKMRAPGFEPGAVR